VALHPLAAGFASVADRYERGRPEYPPAVVGALAAELGLPAQARVLDLAAGTGKLTRALLAGGFDTVAVEPQAELREVLVASAPGADVREGLAEAIPLEDGEVDAVCVADGFHWFDRAAALAEIARVLRPAGGLVLLTTWPDWRGASWAHELGALVRSTRPQHPYFDGPPWQDAVRAAAGWQEPRKVRVTISQPADPERIVDHIASFSWVAALPPQEREETLARMRALILAGDTPAALPVHFEIGIAQRIP
jgi:SAM-dependent methyltransferase